MALPFLIPLLIAAGISSAAGIGMSHIQRATDRAYNSAEALKQRDFAAEEAEKQRAWESEMSSTAHQREVQDMMDAGLNPALSAMGGMGSATPTGAAATSGASASAGGGYMYDPANGIHAASSLLKAGALVGNQKAMNTATDFARFITSKIR